MLRYSESRAKRHVAASRRNKIRRFTDGTNREKIGRREKNTSCYTRAYFLGRIRGWPVARGTGNEEKGRDQPNGQRISEQRHTNRAETNRTDRARVLPPISYLDTRFFLPRSYLSRSFLYSSLLRGLRLTVSVPSDRAFTSRKPSTFPTLWTTYRASQTVEVATDLRTQIYHIAPFLTLGLRDTSI